MNWVAPPRSYFTFDKSAAELAYVLTFGKEWMANGNTALRIRTLFPRQWCAARLTTGLRLHFFEQTNT